jgi:hypothetical protein
MIKVVPIRPGQIVDFFDPDGTPRSVQTIAKVFEGKKEVKHTLVRNWLQAAFVAKDLTAPVSYKSNQNDQNIFQ